jgi:hypothetical protein
MRVLASGGGLCRWIHPDDFREWVQVHKSREQVEKLVTEHEAVSRFVPSPDLSRTGTMSPTIFLP